MCNPAAHETVEGGGRARGLLGEEMPVAAKQERAAVRMSDHRSDHRDVNAGLRHERDEGVSERVEVDVGELRAACGRPKVARHEPLSLELAARGRARARRHSRLQCHPPRRCARSRGQDAALQKTGYAAAFSLEARRGARTDGFLNEVVPRADTKLMSEEATVLEGLLILVVGLVYVVGVAWGTAVVARRRGHQAWMGALIGLFFGLVGLLLVAILPRRKQRSRITGGALAR